MNQDTVKPSNVDQYIALFPEATQQELTQIRDLIKSIVPHAEELISYAIPAYKVNNKALIYFAAYEKHLSLYPLPHNPSSELLSEMDSYIAGRGTLRFPLTAPLPIELIEKVVRHRLADI